MARVTVSVIVAMMFGAIAPSFATCQSGVCEDSSSDEVSLIQGFVEPDFGKPLRHDQEADSNLIAKTTTVKAQAHGTKNKTNTSSGANIKVHTGTTTVKPQVEGTKIKANMAGDLPAFLASVGSCSFMFVFMVFTFMCLQGRYPKMYQYRVPANWKNGIAKSGGAREEYAPEDFKEDTEITTTWFGWARLSLRMSTEEVEACSGLDAAMLLKFSELAIELMLTFGMPFCVFGIPIYAFLGGGFAKDDRLSWAGIGNVVWNSTEMTKKPLSKADENKLADTQWIFWIVSISVWVVVLWTQHRLFDFQRSFITRRHAWLKVMPRPRCTTILVQGVPEENRTDEAFKAFFQKMFPKAQIEDAFVMKNVSKSGLPKLWAAKESLEYEISEAQFKNDTAEVARKQAELKDNMKDISELQKTFKEEAQQGSHVMANGFVTFASRGDAERALNLRMSEDDDLWVFETPPAPTDVIYHDFEMGEHEAEIWQRLGYGAVAGLFFAFMPLVVGISRISLAIEHSPNIKGMLKGMGMLTICDGVLATIGLTTMMCMLPTFLMIIFKVFYTLKAERWAQLRVQEYYFWFLVLFVLLVTAVGTNLVATVNAFAHSPFMAFKLLAHSLPVTTHFYLKYCILQPVTHGMNLTRYFYLGKFMLFTKMVDVNRARELSEPEDQDYYGMGSRSARFTLMLLIGLVFGTICPLMHVVVLLNFLACRLIYGYLIPFAESRKVDLGGEHWAMQILHLHHGLLIYIVMMTGILVQRSESKGPGAVAAVGFLWWYIAYRKFTKALHWEKLPYMTVMEDEEGKASKIEGNKYMQKELEPPTSTFVQ